jgi:iron complex outermembrane receptor protein
MSKLTPARLSKRLLASSSMLAAGAALLALPHAAHAQAQGPASNAAPNGQPADVVVTAEHRTVSLQKVNIAASALGTKDLQKKSVINIATLQNATPSLSVIDQGFSQSINIRGIGLAVVSPQVAPGVATYRDGVFLPTQTSLTQPFYDLQDVQVLRGPQGTFAGDDATGGAIYVNSKSPSLTAGTSGYITAGYGNYNDVQVNGAVNLPISDTLAARIAFNDEQRDSFYKDISPTANGEHPGNLDETDVRVSLLWKPTDALTVLWKNEYDRYANDSFADQPIPGTAFYNLAPKAPFVIDYATPGLKYIDTYYLTSLQINYEFRDGITLKTNSGYQFDDGYAAADQAAAPVPGYLETDGGSGERIWTEDISLVSPDKGPLRWVVGATFFNYSLQPLHAVETSPPEVVDIDVDSPKQSYGVFGSATYSLTPTLDLQVGLRYSQDEVGLGGAVTITSPFFPGFVIPQAAPMYNDDAVTGKVALNWNPNASNLFYVFAARGYKAGGTNGGASTFAPETVWDYEGGWKSTLLDGHLRSQLGAFYMTYQNFQVSEFSPAQQGSAIANADTTSTIAGFEAQAQLQFAAFSADASLSYVYSNIGALQPQIDTRNLPNGGAGLGPPCSAPGVPAGCFNYAPFIQAVPRGPNIYSPNWTANVGAQYAFELGSSTLTPRVDVSYMSQQWATFFEAPEDNLKARTLVNLQLTFQHADWMVQGYATNVFNGVYVSGFSAQFGSNYFLLPPRQFGVRITRSF